MLGTMPSVSHALSFIIHIMIVWGKDNCYLHLRKDKWRCIEVKYFTQKHTANKCQGQDLSPLVAVIACNGQSGFIPNTQLENGCFLGCMEEGLINYRVGGHGRWGFPLHFTTWLKLLLYGFGLEIPKNK